MRSPAIYFLNTQGVFLLLAGVLLYLWYIEKSREEALHILISSGLTTILVFLIKAIFAIPRPYQAYGLDALAGYAVRTTSLPSLHAALAFCLAATVILHQKRFGVILFVAAAIIGFGRIAAHVHYPLDIVVGSILGAAVALLTEELHFKRIRS